MRQSGAAAFKPPSADDPVLREVVRRLVEVYHPLRIYLFGSTARGEAGPDSDYDICVIVPDQAPAERRSEQLAYRSDYDICVIVPDQAPAERRSEQLAYRALRGTGVATEILVWTREEFEKQLHLKASLPAAVMEEGDLLYGAG